MLRLRVRYDLWQVVGQPLMSRTDAAKRGGGGGGAGGAGGADTQ